MHGSRRGTGNPAHELAPARARAVDRSRGPGHSGRNGRSRLSRITIGMAPPLVIGGAALVSAIALLVVTRLTVNQARLAEARNAFMSALRDLRPFRTELSGLWPSLGRLLRANARYARLALVPALILALPLTALFAHLERRFADTGLD